VSATLKLSEGVWEWEGECGNGSVPLEYEDAMSNVTVRQMEVDFVSGAGWLACTGQYQDFAGSGVVHLLGGTCALVACFIIGARVGRFKQGETVDMPGHSVPLAALGGFILIFGFLAFNGGSQGQINSSPDSGATIGLVVINSILAACSGGLTVLSLMRLKGTSWSFLMCLNGTLSGMVSLCAGCNKYEQWQALLVGVGGGVSYLGCHFAMLKAKLDDPIDAVSVHGAAGLFGLLIAPFFTGFESLAYNFIGAAAIILWSALWSVIIFYPLSWLKLLRIPEEMELQGIDIAKHGEAAYPASAWEEDQYAETSGVPSHMRVANTMDREEAFNSMEMGLTTGKLSLEVKGAGKGAENLSGVALTGYTDLKEHKYGTAQSRLDTVDFNKGTPYKSMEETDYNEETQFKGVNRMDGNIEPAYKDMGKTDLRKNSGHKVVMLDLGNIDFNEEIKNYVVDPTDANTEIVHKSADKTDQCKETVNKDMDETDSKIDTISKDINSAKILDQLESNTETDHKQMAETDYNEASLQHDKDETITDKETLQKAKEALPEYKDETNSDKETLQKDKEAQQEYNEETNSDKENLQRAKEVLPEHKDVNISEKVPLQKAKEVIPEHKDENISDKETLQKAKEALQEYKDETNSEKEALQKHLDEIMPSNATDLDDEDALTMYDSNDEHEVTLNDLDDEDALTMYDPDGEDAPRAMFEVDSNNEAVNIGVENKAFTLGEE